MVKYWDGPDLPFTSIHHAAISPPLTSKYPPRTTIAIVSLPEYHSPIAIVDEGAAHDGGGYGANNTCVAAVLSDLMS